MKKIICTTMLLSMVSAAAFAQTEPTDTSRTNRPLIDEKTKQDIREGAEEIKQDVRQGAERVKEGAQQVGEEIREETRRARSDIRRGYDETMSYQERNALPWFDRGSVFAGAGVGFGLARNSGTYLSISPRIGYFIQPGLVAGLRFAADNRLATSFRSREFGAFARYYPFRTRINAFGGVGYNIGREFASNISGDERARYHSITLEAGVGFQILRNLGGEVSLETNYYDRSNALAGRNRGGRARIGINYYFARAATRY